MSTEAIEVSRATEGSKELLDEFATVIGDGREAGVVLDAVMNLAAQTLAIAALQQGMDAYKARDWFDYVTGLMKAQALNTYAGGFERSSLN